MGSAATHFGRLWRITAAFFKAVSPVRSLEPIMLPLQRRIDRD